MKITWLDNEISFPPVTEALVSPNGLLAAGGDLSPTRLIAAYRAGIFPWFNEGEPILWWSPNPRAVLLPHEFKVSRSLQKLLNKNIYNVSFNRDFIGVINACANLRKTSGTWITDAMKHAYIELHHQGIACSIEVWHEENLIGGLYGLMMGKCFFGESMFSSRSNASKVALAHLVKYAIVNEFVLIDCQVSNPHLLSLGAKEISRKDFMQLLKRGLHSAYDAP
jgi:leucyl/phenylalanyl-tRNA--protein transferase